MPTVGRRGPGPGSSPSTTPSCRRACGSGVGHDTQRGESSLSGKTLDTVSTKSDTTLDTLVQEMGKCVRENEILVEQHPPQGVLVCDHAGLVINKFSRKDLSADGDVLGGVDGIRARPHICACRGKRRSYLRLIDSCITQLKAHRPSRTCNESKEERRRRRKGDEWRERVLY